MLSATRSYVSGYPAVILLVAALGNLSTYLGFLGYGLTLPTMRDSLELSHLQEGTLVTAVSASVFASGFVSGMLITRYGSKLAGVGSIVGGVGMILVGSSPNYPFALAVSVVMGLGLQFCIAGSMGLISAWFAPNRRGTAAGLAASGGAVSFIVLGALVPWLTGRDPDDGWRHSWYALAIIAITVGILGVTFFRDRPASPGQSSVPRRRWPTEVYRTKVAWVMASLAFCSAWGQSLHMTFFGVYLEEQGMGIDVAGRLWWVMGLLGVAGTIFWGSTSDRIGRRPALMMSFTTYTVGLAVFWIAPVLAGFIVSTVFVGISLRATYTLCAAAAGDYVPPHLSTAVWGLTAVGAGLGLAIGPPLAGSIADATDNLRWVFVIATAGSAVGIFASTLMRRPREADTESNRAP